MRRSTRAGLALLAVSFTWGATFPVIKSALADAGPLLFLSVRFALALLVALPLWRSLRGRLTAAEGVAGLILGALLAVSFSFQTIALTEIGAARSAFLTSLYVVFVPLLAIPLTRHVPALRTWLGVALALAGLGLMTWDGVGLSWRPGDLMTVGCAVGFALHIIGVGVFTARFDYRRLFLLQIAVATLLLAPASLILEPVRFTPTLRLGVALLITGVLGTTLAFYVQNRVQRHTSATRVAIIFAMEPVFAVVCTALLSGRIGFTPREGLGAALIVTGLIVSELRGRRAGRAV